MIVKALMVVCVVSAAAGKHLDSIVASTFGSTEPSGATVGTTTEDLDAVLEGIFGSTKSSEATSAATQGVKDVDAVLDKIFGSTKSSEATKSTTEGKKDAIIDEIFGSTKSSEATPTWATTEGIKTYGPCVSSEGEKGECVPYYKCEIKPLDIDEYYIDIHLPVDSPCESYLDVCCSPSNRIELTTKPAAVGENSHPPKLDNKSSTVQ